MLIIFIYFNKIYSMSYLNVPISEPWVGGEVGMMTNNFFM